MKMKKIIILALSACTLLTTTGCNGGSGGTNSSSGSAAPTSYILPDATVVLSNGAQISIPNGNVVVQPGKITSTILKVQGGDSRLKLGLSIALSKLSGEATDSLKATLSNADISTGNNISSTKITFDARNTPAGEYLVKVIASKLVGSPTVATLKVSVAHSNMIKASYMQIGCLSSVSTIAPGGYNASNMIIFAFGDPLTSSIDQCNLTSMQTAINNEATGTINLLSLGGQKAHAADFPDAMTVVNNVTAQINAYNKQLSGGKISGVDLDLEGDFTPTMIAELAKGFKQNGLIVSVAPQVYTTGNLDINVKNPNDLNLTAGYPGNSNLNTYGPAISSGFVDYIMAQTYNTGEWTVGGYYENQVEFFSSIARALNNSVKSDCSANTSVSSDLCIPRNTQIVIGEVSNAGASGTINNIFASDGATAYNQAAILAQLSSQIPAALDNSNVNGVMQWSLNNDYMPYIWGDNSATAGAFSTQIFGATAPAAIPHFILQITNSGPDVAGPNAYASATLVVNGQYWIFGAVAAWTQAGMSPILPGINGYQQWGTLPSSQNPDTPNVADSSNLDTIFSNGTKSFTTSQIVINGYPSNDTDILKPANQFNCPSGENYTFHAGHSYNIHVNPAYHTCKISQMN